METSSVIDQSAMHSNMTVETLSTLGRHQILRGAMRNTSQAERDRTGMERQRPADMLAIALRDRRDYLGLNQREAAAQIGIANTYLSQLETGKVGLPSGEVRRRLARFLGISHLDLLLMLGEITADEIAETGQSGVIEPDPKDPRVALRDLLD